MIKAAMCSTLKLQYVSFRVLLAEPAHGFLWSIRINQNFQVTTLHIFVEKLIQRIVINIEPLIHMNYTMAHSVQILNIHVFSC